MAEQKIPASGHLHPDIPYDDDELRKALRAYHTKNHLELPIASTARKMINAFAQWLRDNPFKPILKEVGLSKTAALWLEEVWGFTYD